MSNEPVPPTVDARDLSRHYWLITIPILAETMLHNITKYSRADRRISFATKAITIVTTLALAACSSGGDNHSITDSQSNDPAQQFSLTRSQEGIAQVQAPTMAAASAGIGFAYAQDNFCLLQDYLLTINGERSKYLGPDATNLT